MTKKQILFSAACILAASSAFAQGNGVSGITQATSMVTSYFDPATKLIYAIGAVVGLIGGVKVYCWILLSKGDIQHCFEDYFLFGTSVMLILN